MVSKRGQDILNAYYNYKSGNNPTGSVQNTVSSKDVETAQAVYNHKQSELQINQIDRQLDDITTRLDEKTNDYRMRNPDQDMAQVNLKLRSQDPAYGSLLDDRQNLLEQKQLLQDRVFASERIIEKDIIGSAQQSFSGISNSHPMDSRPVIPSNAPKYNTTFGQNTVSNDNGLIHPKSTEGQTIQAIYDRQTQDRIDNAVQSNYFWQLTTGKVPVGKALYSPETTNTYYYKDQKLSDMKDKDTRMALTEQFLKERGQSMDTPIGEVKFSPTKYTQAREQAIKSAESDFAETQIPMGDLRDLIPDQTKKGDYSGYIPPEQYRKQLLSPQNTTPYQYNSDESLKDSGKIYEQGFGETWKLSPPMTSELSILMFGTPSFAGQQLKTEKEVVIDRPVSLAGFSALFETEKKNDTAIMGSGNVPSFIGGANLFKSWGKQELDDIAQKTKVPNEAIIQGDYSPTEELDWTGNKISEIPDDPWEQVKKGLIAEPFNIVQTGKQLVSGKEQKFAPTIIGDLADAFSSGKIEYKDYTDNFGQNVGIFFDNTGRTISGFADPQVQSQIGEKLGKVGERMQEYPIYYLSTGAVEIGSMVVPVGKIATATKQISKGAIAGTRSIVKTKDLAQTGDVVRQAMKTDEAKVMEQINAILPENAMKIQKVILKGKNAGVYVEKDTLNYSWLNKLTTKINKLERVDMIADETGKPVMQVMSKAKKQEFYNIREKYGLENIPQFDVLPEYSSKTGVNVSGWSMKVYAETGADVANIYGRIDSFLANQNIARTYSKADDAQRVARNEGAIIHLPESIVNDKTKLTEFTSDLRKLMNTYDKGGKIQGARNISEIKSTKGKITDWRRFGGDDAISYSYDLKKARTNTGDNAVDMTKRDYIKLRTQNPTSYNIPDNKDIFEGLVLETPKYKTVKGMQRTDEFQTIEKLGKGKYVVNLSFETEKTGMGYAVFNLKQDKAVLVPKQFAPDAKNPKLAISTSRGLFDAEQWGAIYTIDGKVLRSKGVNEQLFKAGLKRAVKESESGMVDESFLKMLGDSDDMQKGMNILKQDSGLTDKLKINPNTDSVITAKTKVAQTEELAQIKNFDDMYERTPVWATPSSSNPIFLGQGADTLYKDAITRGADAGLIARAKDKFWYGLGVDKPLPKLIDANLTKEETRQYISRNVALRNFALKQINKIPAFGENTKLGKMLKDKGWMNPKFEPLNQEVYTSGFAGRSKLDKLVAQRDDLKRKVLSADGTFEDQRLLNKIEKDIAKTEKETMFSESDQWFKLVEEDGQYVVATKKTKSGVDEVINTTDEYKKLIQRQKKRLEGAQKVSDLRSMKYSKGLETDKSVTAIQEMTYGYTLQITKKIKTLRTKRKALKKKLKSGRSSTGSKLDQGAIDDIKIKLDEVDAEIASVEASKRTDPILQKYQTALNELKKNTSVAFEKRIMRTVKKYSDDALEKDYNLFQKENFKLSKESNTYAFNRDAVNLPQIKFRDPIGKRKSKQSLNDALKDETSINNELKEEIERFIKDQKKFNRENPKWTPDDPKSNKGLLSDFQFFKDKHKDTQFDNIIGSFRENSNIVDGIIDKTYGAPLGIIPAFGQGANNVQSQPTKTVQPQNTIPTVQPRIGTTNLFRPNTSFENISKETAKVIPKIGTTTDLTIKTENIQRNRADTRTDVMQSTAQAVKQVGDTAQKLGQQFKQIQQYAFKATEMNPPKLTTTPLKPKVPVRKPVIIPTPTLPVIPPFFGSGSKRKRKKKKTSKDKKKLAVWAVPDVWFDAKGYYFKDGQAYLTGASAKKALRKSKKQ